MSMFIASNFENTYKWTMRIRIAVDGEVHTLWFFFRNPSMKMALRAYMTISAAGNGIHTSMVRTFGAIIDSPRCFARSTQWDNHTPGWEIAVNNRSPYLVSDVATNEKDHLPSDVLMMNVGVMPTRNVFDSEVVDYAKELMSSLGDRLVLKQDPLDHVKGLNKGLLLVYEAIEVYITASPELAKIRKQRACPPSIVAATLSTIREKCGHDRMEFTPGKPGIQPTEVYQVNLERD